MSWRRILVYYVLAALIGGGVYFEQRMQEPLVPRDLTATPIVEYLSSRIDALTLEGEGVRVIFAKSNGRWGVVEPSGIDIGSDLVDALLDTLTTIPPVEMLRDQSGNLGQFGLDSPRFRLELVSEGEDVAVVEIGRRNPTRTAIYARADGEGPIFLLGFNAQYYVDLIVSEVEDQR
jgi:hypothetical protein